VVTTPALFFDDGVYDDPFASDARRCRLAIKHIFEGGAILEVTGSWLGKDYTGTLALDSDGLPFPELRRDRVWGTGASIRLPLFPQNTGAVLLDLDLAYRYTRHRSNDAFYNYTLHSLIAGVSVTY
jgi:hypothetical protein